MWGRVSGVRRYWMSRATSDRRERDPLPRLSASRSADKSREIGLCRFDTREKRLHLGGEPLGVCRKLTGGTEDLGGGGAGRCGGFLHALDVGRNLVRTFCGL